MINFEVNYNINGAIIRLLSETGGGFFSKKRTSYIPADNWDTQNGLNAMSSFARLETALENNESGIKLVDEGAGYELTHKFIASLTNSQAVSLGLPSIVPFKFRLDSDGPLIADFGKIHFKWTGIGGKQVFSSREGVFLKEGDVRYRIPIQLYNLIELIDEFNGARELDDRLALLAQIKTILSAYGIDKYSSDNQLDGIEIIHASALSLNIIDNADGVDFDPVLFNRNDIPDGSSEDQIRHSLNLLSPLQQDDFAYNFRKKPAAKSTYLADDVFVYIDPSLREVTEEIRRIQDSSQETKHRFIRSPHSFIREKMIDQGVDEEFIDEMIASSFVVTQEFSDRVKNLGIWQPPVIPFQQKDKTNWHEIVYGLQIGGEKYYINEDQLNSVAKHIADAITNHEDTVSIGHEVNIPANVKTLSAVNALRDKVLGLPPVEIPDDDQDDDLEDLDTDKDKKQRSALLVENNFESESFVLNLNKRINFTGFIRPTGLLNEPKNHQIEGVEWLQETWSKGYPGVLLADDMGLGKTFQTLAFLSWLRDVNHTRNKKNPILIVAPTSLLGTWQKEAKIHLESSSLGSMVLLYSSHLKNLKINGSKGNDVTLGRSCLHLDLLRQADWVLTTYETMRDYHISLAKVEFSCLIFDEMQKIKNISSMMTNAAQSLNADFKLGLTGTPVENSLQDIWTLYDTLMPGGLGLGSLKEFTNYYIGDEHLSGNEKSQRIQALSDRFLKRLDDNPPPMLRRLKSDVAKDLPEKIEHVLDGQMPDDQALNYHEALMMLKNGKSAKQKIEAFHSMRRVSLHPYSPDHDFAQDPSVYIGLSARLNKAFDLLDQIHKKNEKALVFVESIAMHEWLSVYLKVRYRLDHTPARIFGGVSAIKRQEITERFQSSENKGFDVLLLSPKAAGVGLTLTAATHVIHLTRWWNPAVEDQCTDRAYRIGQDKKVNVYYLRALHPVYQERSFDGLLHQLLESKRSVSRNVLSPNRESENIEAIISDLSNV